MSVEDRGPIIVCTRNDDLDCVIEATPITRHPGLPYSRECLPCFPLQTWFLFKMECCCLSSKKEDCKIILKLCSPAVVEQC